jgi:hypothetical protein
MSLDAEALEGRELLSIDFQQTFYVVGDQKGAAAITLNHDGMWPPKAEQAELTLTGVTAIPGFDYAPTPLKVAVTAGQDSTTVKLPIIHESPSAGNRIVEVALSPSPGSPPTEKALVLIAHSPDTTPPKVIATKMLTKGPWVTGFVITFSKDMARGPVHNVNNYEVDDPRSVLPFKRADLANPPREVPLNSATYDPSTHSVTLSVAGRVKKFRFFPVADRQFASEMELELQAYIQQNASNPSTMLPPISPIADTTGNPLASPGSGTPDGHFEAIVTQGNAGNRLLSKMNQIPSAPAPMKPTG